VRPGNLLALPILVVFGLRRLAELGVLQGKTVQLREPKGFPPAATKVPRLIAEFQDREKRSDILKVTALPRSFVRLASRTTKSYLSGIRKSAAGTGDLTDRRQQKDDGLSEAEAIERAKQGDAEAFQALYDRHKRRVYSLCLRMTANTAEAEDLAQEAFLQLFRKIGTFRGESAFSTWLHRLSVNVVLMHLRKKSLPVVSLEETTQNTEEDSPKKDFGAEDLSLAGSIDRLQLQKAVESLPPGYRTIFVLHDVEGYEHNEIAGIVGCSIGNSKSQLHKARMKLRDILRIKRAEKAGKS
jgi:RNA polymerase sigma-70 factor (ECF subfamily)